VAVQKKSCHQFIRTRIVRFIGGYSGIYDRGKRPFSPVTGAGAASILLGGEANSSLEERKSYWQRLWVRPTICRLLALNVGSLAGIVSPGLPLLARNVSRKCPLFASSRATVCEPLQLGILGRRYAHPTVSRLVGSFVRVDVLSRTSSACQTYAQAQLLQRPVCKIQASIRGSRHGAPQALLKNIQRRASPGW